MTRNSDRMPSVIEASARLNGGQPSGSLMKSVTEPVAEAVEDVAERPADQHPGGQPDQRPAEVQGEVDEQDEQRDADQDRHAELAARQEAEGDTVVARVDELRRPAGSVVLRPARSTGARRALTAGRAPTTSARTTVADSHARAPAVDGSHRVPSSASTEVSRG